MLIRLKHPRPTQYDDNDLRVYKSLVVQTKVRFHPNPASAARPHATRKYKHMLRKIVIPGERIVGEESEDTASVGNISEPSATDSIRGIDESTDSGIL